MTGGDGTAAMLLLSPSGPANLALLEPALIAMPPGFKPERLSRPQPDKDRWGWQLVGTRDGVQTLLNVITCGETFAGYQEKAHSFPGNPTSPLFVGPTMMVFAPKVAPGSDAGPPDPDVYIVALDPLVDQPPAGSCCAYKNASSPESVGEPIRLG